MPFQDGPMPNETRRVDEGNIGCVVYPAGGFRKKEVVVRFGRWRASNGRFYLSEFVPQEDLDDLLTVVTKARQLLTPQRKTRPERQ
jgi:hypothetical protein